jgi:DNA modification methylase
VVALELGRSFVGVELNPEYIALGQNRLDGLIYSGKLPAKAEPEVMEVAG